jgi:AsmA protein
VRGFTKRDGWSKAPIDVSLMQLFDADARLRIDGLRIAGLSIGQTALRTTLNSGSVRADIEEMQLYGGRGRGVVTARANNSAINVGLNLSISQVSAQPLLKDAADIDMIAGSGQLTAAVGSVGRSQHDIMSGLAGRASFTFNDGALIGWNIPAMLRGLQKGQVGGLAKTETQKTDFSELTANFTVSRGVANTQDLRMIGPLLRLSGSGNTDLGRRQLDMILRPKLVASLAGQGGQRDLTGLEVPVRITGDWNKPKIKPDVSSVLKNPDKVQETVKSIREQFKGKNAGEIVRDLLGGDKDGQGSKAGNLLKQLFKN